MHRKRKIIGQSATYAVGILFLGCISASICLVPLIANFFLQLQLGLCASSAIIRALRWGSWWQFLRRYVAGRGLYVYTHSVRHQHRISNGEDADDLPE